MAWFSKPKRSVRSEPVTPALCARCGERPGTVLMHFVTGADERPLEPGARMAWLCDVCRNEVGRDAADN